MHILDLIANASFKIYLSGVKGQPAAAQKPTSATNKTTSKGQVGAGTSTKAAEQQNGNASTKEKIVVPENAYAADWEEVTG